jgi:hypothetical protein
LSAICDIPQHCLEVAVIGIVVHRLTPLLLKEYLYEKAGEAREAGGEGNR